MVWTHPMTFVDGAVLTASQLNTHLRDNLLETEAAKAVQQGDTFVTAAVNRIERRRPGSAFLSTSESTSESDWTDLITVGPQVTCVTGARCLIWLGCQVGAASANSKAMMSFDVQGATERDALDTTEMAIDGLTASAQMKRCAFDLLTDLTPGTNIFTAKYRTGGVSGTFSSRFLATWPL